ncbi:MAG TPA: hypothetical protein VMG10_29555 [Gemmataceae bacterium]|nr:hypothetical protein [Gemmataceae bacterium]
MNPIVAFPMMTSEAIRLLDRSKSLGIQPLRDPCERQPLHKQLPDAAEEAFEALGLLVPERWMSCAGWWLSWSRLPQ